MPGSSTGSFEDAADYKASVADIFAQFTVTGPGAFAAHVDRTRLRHISLLHAPELLARVAYVALPPDQVFLSFAADPKAPLVWRGIALEPDEIMLHGSGEHLHQRTCGPSRWGLISLSPASLVAYCQAETGDGLLLSQRGRIYRRRATGNCCFAFSGRLRASPKRGLRLSVTPRSSAPWNSNWPGRLSGV